MGALAGFLYWNRPRARLFMGDCGSLFIGAIVGGITLVPVFHPQIAFVGTTVLAVLILVVPLFDTAFVLVLRRLAGLSATRGGTDHVSHRLVSLGFSERSATRILYLLGLVGGLTAWVLVRWNSIEPMLVVAVFGFFLAFGVLTIEPSVIASWVGNDPTYPPGPHVVSIELLHVALFLAGFSGLYFTVVAITDELYRRQFFTVIMEELARAVSMRVIYRMLDDE